MLFAPTQSLFTWRGHYWGFIRDDRIFDAGGSYRGFIEDREAWKKDGSFWGEYLADGYILRPLFCNSVLPHVPPLMTFRQSPPLFTPSDRWNRIDRFGYQDPLED